MGVRLYPILKTDISTAKFLDIPEKYQAGVKAFDEMDKFFSIIDREHDLGFELYELRSKVDEVNRIHSFELIGWGKHPMVKFLSELCKDEYAGVIYKETNPGEFGYVAEQLGLSQYQQEMMLGFFYN